MYAELVDKGQIHFFAISIVRLFLVIYVILKHHYQLKQYTVKQLHSAFVSLNQKLQWKKKYLDSALPDK